MGYEQRVSEITAILYRHGRRMVMGQLIVLVFDDPAAAGELRQTLRDVEHQGKLDLDDTAVVVKDAAGKIHVDNQVDRGVKYGVLAGGVLGAMVLFMFPLAGLVAGATTGAVLGRRAKMGIDKSFVKEVQEALGPNSSALFLMVSDAEPGAALAALRPYHGSGHVYYTSLDPKQERKIQRALR
jgi:uncharacterized membrane protein